MESSEYPKPFWSSSHKLLQVLPFQTMPDLINLKGSHQSWNLTGSYPKEPEGLPRCQGLASCAVAPQSGILQALARQAAGLREGRIDVSNGKPQNPCPSCSQVTTPKMIMFPSNPTPTLVGVIGNLSHGSGKLLRQDVCMFLRTFIVWSGEPWQVGCNIGS